MLEVAKGIQYIHAEGIIHGDIRGVGIDVSHVVNLFLSSCTRKTYSSTLTYIAKLPILDYHRVPGPPC
jgi:serine/threonine protein kinase